MKKLISVVMLTLCLGLFTTTAFADGEIPTTGRCQQTNPPSDCLIAGNPDVPPIKSVIYTIWQIGRFVRF